MWGAIREKDDFCVKFSKYPNETVNDVDVVVCTSVLGAGFSITRCFESFHTFLFNNIITHDEGQQFIRRLRFVCNDLPINAIRQSYVFAQKASVCELEYNMVLHDFSQVRRKLLQNSARANGITLYDNVHPTKTLLGLEQTLSRVRSERARTFNRHADNCRVWGKTIMSSFEEYAIDDDDADTEVKKSLLQFKNVWTGHIVDLVINGIDNVSSILSSIEVGICMPLYRACTALDVGRNMSDMFISDKVAMGTEI